MREADEAEAARAAPAAAEEGTARHALRLDSGLGLGLGFGLTLPLPLPLTLPLTLTLTLTLTRHALRLDVEWRPTTTPGTMMMLARGAHA